MRIESVVLRNMPNPYGYPPLKPLHPLTTLNHAKLAELRRLTTDELKHSLKQGQKHSLKTRPDGTIIDGNHRIHVLRERGVNVEALPREIIPKYGFEFPGKD